MTDALVDAVEKGESTMTRKIIGTIITVLVAVRMLMT